MTPLPRKIYLELYQYKEENKTSTFIARKKVYLKSQEPRKSLPDDDKMVTKETVTMWYQGSKVKVYVWWSYDQTVVESPRMTAHSPGDKS